MTLQSALAAVAIAGPAFAQSYDIYPAYHPDGPDAGLIEVELDAPLTIEVSLPGLDHTASQAVAASYLTFLAVSGSPLATPVPLGPAADLWLDPIQLALLPVGPSLTLDLTLPFDPTLVDGEVPTQVFALDLADPLLTLHGSDLILARLVAPIVDYGVELRPGGADRVGTEVAVFDAAANAYRLTFTEAGTGAVTEYLIDLNDPAVQQGSISVFETQTQTFPAIFGGFHYVQGGTEYSPLAFEAFGSHTLLSHGLSGTTVTLDYLDELPAPGGGTTVHTRSIAYTLDGRSLMVRGWQTDGDHSADDNYIGFSLGNQAALSPTSTFEPVRVPFMDQIGITLLDDDLFFESFLDLYRSSAQGHIEAGFWTFANLAAYTEMARYEPDTAGERPAIDETGWLTVSPSIEDAYVHSNAAKGPHADDFAHMVAVAFSKELNTTSAYFQDLQNVKRMQAWGMEDVLVWKTHWMNAGQNRRATTHVPPNPEGGPEADLTAFVQEAVTGGWRVALYTDFYSLDQAQGFDDNPAYSEEAPVYINYGDGVKDGTGAYRLGFGTVEDPATPKVGQYNTRLLAPRRAYRHFEREATAMQADYGVNANYFDVMTISSPDLIVTGAGLNQGVISGDHRSPNDRTVAAALNSYCDLFRRASLFLNGPVLGEGSFWLFERRWDTFYMGYLDGAWRTLSTGGPPTQPGTSGENQVIVPDYEVNVVRPKMPGLFGMGQYTRFFQGGLYPVPYDDDPLYLYRSFSISYGHNGYMMSLSIEQNGGDYLEWAQQIKEYYTMRGLHDEWNAATGATVAYKDGQGGPWMDLSTALKTDLDLKSPVLRLTYDTGLVVTVNHSGATVTEGGYQLPHRGWTAVNPNTGYLNLSVLDTTTGARIDHVACAAYEMADGNGVAVDFGGAIGVTSDLEVVNFAASTSLSEEPTGSILVQ